MSTPTEILHVRGLTCLIGGLAVLTDIDVDVSRSEVLGIIGPNGAGKSSFVNCITGFYPYSGLVRWDGHEVRSGCPSDVTRRGVTRTFQELSVFEHLDVEQNLLMGRHRHLRQSLLLGSIGIGPARQQDRAQRRRVEAMIDRLELGRFCGMPVGLLPYGVQKRVETARALMTEPVALLLDEPTAGLNDDEAALLLEVVMLERERTGLSVIVIEHNLALVMATADRVLVLSSGTALTCDEPERVRQDDRVIATYVGEDLVGTLEP